MKRTLALCLLAILAGALEVGVSPLIGHRATVRAILPLDDGTVLTCDGMVRLWDAASQRLRWVQGTPGLRSPALESVSRPPVLAATTDRVFAAWGSEIIVFDRRSGREIRRIATVFNTWLGFTPDGSCAISAAQGGLGWTTTDGRSGFTDTGGHGWLTWAAFTADGGRAYVGVYHHEDGPVLELQREGPGWRLARVLRTATAVGGASVSAGCLASLGDGRPVLATAHADGTLAWWAMPPEDRPKPLGTMRLRGPPNQFHTALIPAGPGRILHTESDYVKRQSLLDLTTGTALPALGDDREVFAVAALGRTVFAADRAGSVALTDITGTTTLGWLSQAPAASAVSARVRDASGRWLCVGTADGIWRWDLALLRLVGEVPTEARAELADLGQGVAAFSYRRYGDEWYAPRRWRCLDPAGPGWLDRIEGRARPVVLPGCRLAVPDDEAVRIHDLTARAEVGRIELPAVGNTERMDLCTASPDGMRLMLVRGGDRYFRADDAGKIARLPSRAMVVEVGSWRIIGGCEIPREVLDPAADDPVVWIGAGWRLPGGRATLSIDGRLLPGQVERPAAVAAAEPVADPGPAWYARVAVDTGHLGELRLTAPSGGCVHLLSAGGSWAVWDDAGHFDGDRSAGRLLVATADGAIAALDEVAPWANRPDRLLAGLGCTDAALLAAAAAPADRRRRDEAAARPVVRIAAAEASHGRLRLRVAATAAAGLGRLEAWVNGVPLPSQPASGTAAEGLFELLLGPGENTVEVAVVDTGGVRSWRVPNPAPARPAAGGLVAACLGVSRYRDAGLTLRYAAKDAIDLGLALCDAPGQARVRVHVDGEVRPEVLSDVRRHFAAATVDDTAVLYLAGHGLYLRNPDPVYHYLPWGADPADLTRTAIPWPAILTVLADCPARRRLIILDTCESGALEDEAGAGAAGLSIAGARGLRAIATADLGAGLAREFRADDRSRYVTADLDRAGGVVVLASARGGEPSFESEPDANGVFTQCLLDSLRSAGEPADIATDELVRRLAAEVARRSGGRQRPTIDRDNALAGIRLPLLPPAE